MSTLGHKSSQVTNFFETTTFLVDPFGEDFKIFILHQIRFTVKRCMKLKELGSPTRLLLKLSDLAHQRITIHH